MNRMKVIKQRLGVDIHIVMDVNNQARMIPVAAFFSLTNAIKKRNKLNQSRADFSSLEYEKAYVHTVRVI